MICAFSSRPGQRRGLRVSENFDSSCLLKGTSTAFVGDLANFLVGCSFVLPASILYQKLLSKKGR